jgi:hypothetical protein
MKENGDTRGLSQRELILTLMKQVENLNDGMIKRPTRVELYGTIGAVTSITLGIIHFA